MFFRFQERIVKGDIIMDSFSDFFEDYFLKGFVSAFIIIMLVGVIGSLSLDSVITDQHREYNLYSALVQNENKATDVNTAKAAQLTQQIFSSKSSSQEQVANLSKLKSIDIFYLNLVLDKNNVISSLISGSTTDISHLVIFYKWSSFALYFLLFIWLCVSLCTTVNFVNESISSRESLFNWPWKRVWTYPMIIIMSPFLLLAMLLESSYRLVVLLVKLVSNKNETQPESKEFVCNNELEIKALRLIDHVRNQIDVVREVYLYRCLQDLDKVRDNLQDEVSFNRDELINLGDQIKITQFNLAKSERDLSEYKSNLENLKNKSKYQFILDFEQILKIKHVAAVDVNCAQLSVYTEMVYIDYQSKRYQIGIIVIDIDIEKLSFLKLTNLCSTHPGNECHPYGSNFCWGGLNGSIRNTLKNGEFASTVEFMIQAIHSAQGDNPDKVKEWKEV